MITQYESNNYGFDLKFKSTLASTMLTTASLFGGINNTQTVSSYIPNHLYKDTLNESVNSSSNESGLKASFKSEFSDSIVYVQNEKLLDKRLYDNLYKITRFRNFKDNWNGNNAPRFSERLLNHVQDLILKLDHQPEIFPVADNSIQLEYDEGKSYLEIQIFDSNVSVYEEKNEKTEEFETSNDIVSINKIVNSFYGK